MSNQRKRYLIGTEEMEKEVLDIHVKMEIKTEEEGLPGRSHGFICPQCKAHFLYDDLFIEHVKEHHTNMNSENSNLNELKNILSTIYNGSKTTPVIEGNFQCEICSYSTSHRAELLIHQHSHTDRRPYKCEKCSQAYKRKAQLVAHERVHASTGEISFTWKSSLVNRKRPHIGEKLFKCQQCSSAFFVKFNLIRHKKIHSGEKPFKCQQCTAAFIQKCHLVVTKESTLLRSHSSVRNALPLSLKNLIF